MAPGLAIRVATTVGGMGKRGRFGTSEVVKVGWAGFPVLLIYKENSVVIMPQQHVVSSPLVEGAVLTSDRGMASMATGFAGELWFSTPDSTMPVFRPPRRKTRDRR